MRRASGPGLLLLLLLSLVAASALAQDVAPGRVTLRPDEVDRVAARKLGKVRGCYKEALERSARSYGTIGIGFRIAPDGRVTERFVALSTLADPKLEGCILAAFEGVRFPAPGGFGAVARFGVQLKTEDSPAASLKTQEEAYKRAIRDLPAGLPEAAPGRTPTLPGMGDLDTPEPFGPIATPTPKP